MSFLAYLCLFVLGACVGSFVNVAVFRFGFDERASSRSRCMACDSVILWHDLVPIFSYCALRGRCRSCGSSLSLQYPVVEFTLGALFVVTWWAVPPLLSLWSLVAFVALLVFLSAFVAIVAYDLRHTLVPMPFVWVLGASALGAAAAQSFFAGSLAPFLDGLSGAGALFLFFITIVALTKERGMGAGDAYVAAGIGMLFGFARGIEAVMFGVWIGTLLSLALLALSSLSRKNRLFGRRLHVTMKTEVPFAPFLFIGTLLALYSGLSPLAAAASLSNSIFLGHV